MKLRPFLLAVAFIGLAGGFGIRLFGHPGWSGIIWTAATIPVLLALTAEILLGLKRGEVGLDIVAALLMSFALAFGEALDAIANAACKAWNKLLATPKTITSLGARPREHAGQS